MLEPRVQLLFRNVEIPSIQIYKLNEFIRLHDQSKQCWLCFLLLIPHWMYDILLTQIMNIFIERWYVNFSNYIYLFYDNSDKQFNDMMMKDITYTISIN